MDVTIIEAESRLRELIRAVEGGDQVIITRDGKPVAQITKAPPPLPEQKPRLGTMKGRIKFNPGWDDPIDLDRFLAGDF
jgi:prevent-host-death family protein